jgi:hypothetical protein
MTGLIALFLIAVFAVLAGLSQHSGFPALTIVVLAIVTSTIISNYSAWIVQASFHSCGAPQPPQQTV